MHGSDDVCIGQELLRDELTGSHSNSEGVAASGHCGDGGQQAHLVNFFTQAGPRPGPVGNKGLLSSADFALLQFCRCQHQTLAGRTAPRSGGRGCRRIDVPPVSPALHFLVEHVADGQLRCVLPAHPTEKFLLSTSCLRALPAAVVLPMGRHQSMEGCMRLVRRQRASAFQLPVSPEPSRDN